MLHRFSEESGKGSFCFSANNYIITLLQNVKNVPTVELLDQWALEKKSLKGGISGYLWMDWICICQWLQYCKHSTICSVIYLWRIETVFGWHNNAAVQHLYSAVYLSQGLPIMHNCLIIFLVATPVQQGLPPSHPPHTLQLGGRGTCRLQ